MEDKNTGRWIKRLANGTWVRARTTRDAVHEYEAAALARKKARAEESRKERSLTRALPPPQKLIP